MKFRKLSKIEKLALIPVVGSYCEIKHQVGFYFYQMVWYFVVGIVIGEMI